MTELEYDVLIIGSGAGGGTVAARLSKLCASGARIAVVEAGPHYERQHFSMREPEMLSLFVDRGAVPARNFEIAVSAASCVGGSTSVYTGVTFRAPDGLIADWSRDFDLPELSEADVQARFARLETEIDAHYPGPELENTNNRVFREACEKLGWPLRRFRVNIKDCQRCGFCNLGCPYGSKRGTLEVQIPHALSAGVELIPNCRILRLSDGARLSAEGVISAAPAGTRESPHGVGPVRISAKRIVLAAGVLGSAPLLLRSKLPGLSPACGRYLTLHPALTSFGQMPFEVSGHDGFPKLYYTDRFSESEHYYIETAFYFPFVTARSLPGFGAELKSAMRGYNRMACGLTLVHDEPEAHNRLQVAGGKTVLDYRLSARSRRALLHALQSVGRLYFAAGAERYIAPISDRFAIEHERDLESAISTRAFQSGRVVVSSAHPMGGCRMGGDFATSVTNAWGELHNHPKITVADASLFPTSSKVNPYLTIMALADRIAERLVSQQDLS